MRFETLEAICKALECQPGDILTEHTLIFVMKGMKLLHFSEGTIQVGPDEVILLRKGIYVMAEYVEDGLDFEAVMLFLPMKMLRAPELLGSGEAGRATAEGCGQVQHRHALVLPATSLIQGFKDGFRRYFEAPPAKVEALLPLKQKEILFLLLSGSRASEVKQFIRSAVSADPTDIDYVVRCYLFQPVSVAELAKLANCSVAKFKRDFQRIYQCAPKSWITQKRLEHAHLLLQNTDRLVSEIALDCGFESVSHFIRLFRKAYLCTPTEQRAKMAMV